MSINESSAQVPPSRPRRITGQEYNPDDFDIFRQEERAIDALLTARDYAIDHRDALLNESVRLIEGDDVDLDDDDFPEIDFEKTPVNVEMTRRFQARAVARAILRGLSRSSGG